MIVWALELDGEETQPVTIAVGPAPVVTGDQLEAFETASRAMPERGGAAEYAGWVEACRPAT
jgi:hypothetical protein